MTVICINTLYYHVLPEYCMIYISQGLFDFHCKYKWLKTDLEVVPLSYRTTVMINDQTYSHSLSPVGPSHILPLPVYGFHQV